ncbi:MAG: hypothetical protein Kow0026_03940 [Oricola sp.]
MAEILVRAAIDIGYSVGVDNSVFLKEEPFELLGDSFRRTFDAAAEIFIPKPSLGISDLDYRTFPSALNNPLGAGMTVYLTQAGLIEKWRAEAESICDALSFSEEHQFSKYGIDRAAIKRAISNSTIGYFRIDFYAIGVFFTTLSIQVESDNPVLLASMFEAFEYSGYGETIDGRNYDLVNNCIKDMAEFVYARFASRKLSEVSRREEKKRRVHAGIEIYGFSGIVVTGSRVPEGTADLVLHSRRMEEFRCLDSTLYFNWWCSFVTPSSDRPPHHTLYILQYGDLCWVCTQAFERFFQRMLIDKTASYFSDPKRKTRYTIDVLRSLRLLAEVVVSSTKKEFFSNHQQVLRVLDLFWDKADIATRQNNILSASETFFNAQTDEIQDSARRAANKLNLIVLFFTIISVIGVNTAIASFLLDLDVIKLKSLLNYNTTNTSVLAAVCLLTVLQCLFAGLFYAIGRSR